jgi:hypothetical protein
MFRQKGCDIPLPVMVRLFKKCDTCKHFVDNDNTCIKYSPHYIVDTCANDTCEEWEEL